MREPTPAAPQATPALISGGQAFREALASVTAQARLQLSLLSFDLEARTYGDEAFVETVRRFALSHERARVRVLINDTERTMRRAHRLVELGRQLSSRIQFRQLPEEHRGLVEEYLIADERALLFRERSDALEARLECVPLSARLKLRAFDPLWEQSTPARELAELRI